MAIAGILGVALALIERRLSPTWLMLVPSGATLGLAFVIPAGTSITLFLGAAIASVLHRLVPNWSSRFLLSVAAGLVAGESLYGVVAAWF
ncbi:MAG: OPT/YSL family transporter [Hyphomicrobiales bacterium]